MTRLYGGDELFIAHLAITEPARRVYLLLDRWTSHGFGVSWHPATFQGLVLAGFSLKVWAPFGKAQVVVLSALLRPRRTPTQQTPAPKETDV